MEPEKAEELLRRLKLQYSQKTFTELEAEAKKLVGHINSLRLQILRRKPSHEHIGAIIVDAVLQIGHRYETHVGPRAERLRKNYPEAATISGFLRLLKTVGARKLIDWKGANVQKAIYDHAKFFASEGIETFPDLYKWLGAEENRDRLITELPEIDGIGRIGDKTADYYRVLVRHPDAVKVDSRVEEFLKDADIDVTKYAYKGLRSIVELAAKQLGKRPIDLDGAIWNYQGREKRDGERRKSRTMNITAPPAGCWFPMREAKKFARQYYSRFKGLSEEIDDINDLKPIGQFTKGLGLNTVRRGKYKKVFEKYRIGNR